MRSKVFESKARQLLGHSFSQQSLLLQLSMHDAFLRHHPSSHSKQGLGPMIPVEAATASAYSKQSVVLTGQVCWQHLGPV